MSHSQNGWPVVGRDATTDLIVHGVHFPNGVLRGDVAVVLGHVAEQYHARVEQLHPGWCWGWFVRGIEGSTAISNHASATALDFDAPRHQLGDPASKSMSEHQIAECRAIVHECEGVVRWGGDYHGRPDPMHWEIVGDPAQVAKLAGKIRGNPQPQPKPSRTEQTVKSLPSLQQGAKGTDVRRAQALANVTLGGGDVPVDGDFGPKTTAIMKRVQAAAHLPQDGIVGDNTWAALLGVH